MFPTRISTVETNAAVYPGLELLATAVVLLTDELGISYANPAAENLFELSKRQLVGIVSNKALTAFRRAAPTSTLRKPFRRSS